ncbi:helix-turn-helix transcriptional regulator [Bacillus sp. NTK034]|uniref:helix-turn-helix transcriptional regulator n=1 Tax=Bacillus sp. NTK034 TaxID=2802176 RepID=UPI001A8CD7A9|nr:helix-turn-helix transcriptional regulator [Bacillus sp. NTK034]MBN8201438.1 helix-turn-helix transcriptional regulator [Bacillus sp. NTK034]
MYPAIGDKLRMKRLARNLTQKEAAKIIGVSVYMISAWERYFPSTVRMEQLAALYDFSFEELRDDDI